MKNITDISGLRLVIDEEAGELFLFNPESPDPWILHSAIDGGSSTFNFNGPKRGSVGYFTGVIKVERIPFEYAIHNSKSIAKIAGSLVDKSQNQNNGDEKVSKPEVKVSKEPIKAPEFDVFKIGEKVPPLGLSRKTKKKWINEYKLFNGIPKDARLDFHTGQAKVETKAPEVKPVIVVAPSEEDEQKMEKAIMEQIPPDADPTKGETYIKKVATAAKEKLNEAPKDTPKPNLPDRFLTGSGNYYSTLDGVEGGGYFIGRHFATNDSYAIARMPRTGDGFSPCLVFPKEETANYCLNQLKAEPEYANILDGSSVFPCDVIRPEDQKLDSVIVRNVVTFLEELSKL